MNYEKIYDSIIERARNRYLTEYTEKHHIIPRCMGGSDEISNLVELTPEEHFVAHQLLTKIYPQDARLALAAHMMTASRPSNKLYGWLRRRHSNAMSIIQSGKNNSQFGTMWIHNIETKEVKRIKNTDGVPIGWEKGRTSKRKECECRFCGNTFTYDSSVKRTLFCSNKCAQYHKSIAIYVIDNNIEDMIKKFVECESITKILHSYGISGRRGNRYFSSILKDMNLSVARRRNSS